MVSILIVSRLTMKKGNEELNTLISVFTDTSRLHQKYHHKIFESFNLHRGQGRLFNKLGEADGITQRELATRMNITPATLCRMVQNMEKKGLVFRKTDENDQRKTLVYLTDEGLTVRRKLNEKLQIIDGKIFQDFTKEEIDQLEIMLLRIQDQLKKELDIENYNPIP